MGLLAFFLIGLSLSMDAFAVSVSNGMCYEGFGSRQAFTSSCSFGLFQALMPTIGYFAGRTFSDAIQSLDHWIALILLGIIGGKMVLDSVKELREPESCPCGRGRFTGRVLLLQSVATSIDALAVGVSFAIMDANIFTAAAIIGVTTFLCCMIGTRLGNQFGLLLGRWAEIAGGFILIGIGLKIFLEHTLGG